MRRARTRRPPRGPQLAAASLSALLSASCADPAPILAQRIDGKGTFPEDRTPLERRAVTRFRVRNAEAPRIAAGCCLYTQGATGTTLIVAAETDVGERFLEEATVELERNPEGEEGVPSMVCVDGDLALRCEPTACDRQVTLTCALRDAPDVPFDGTWRITATATPRSTLWSPTTGEIALEAL